MTKFIVFPWCHLDGSKVERAKHVNVHRVILEERLQLKSLPVDPRGLGRRALNAEMNTQHEFWGHA